MKLRTRQGRKEPRRLRVLVADDSAAVRRLLGRLLSGLRQFELVAEASDGCQALRGITRLRPDLVILDIRMPRMTGLEVLAALRKRASCCRVIVFSQLGDEVYRTKCLELGAKAFFDKVADFDAFHGALKQMSSEISSS